MSHCPSCEQTVDGGARFCPFCGSQMAVVQSAGDDPYLGKLVGGKYLVEKLLGEGGMGRVYKAVQQPLEKAVVLKVLRSSLQGDVSLVARFQREARAASRLSHPNSIQVTDFGQMEDGALYIAMEYLEGRDLAEEMAAVGPFSEERIVHVMSQMLSALADAHASGVIHRDLKPENVMLVPRRDDPDYVKVLDFGIAKLQDVREGPDAVALTQAGLVCGTPEYMSPEQARGEDLDPRSDIYALGVLMYQLATGELPFQADSSIGFVTKHLTAEPEPPRKKRPEMTPELEAVILRCMSKDREARPAGAEALREELRALGRPPLRGTVPAFAAPPAPGALAPPERAGEGAAAEQEGAAPAGAGRPAFQAPSEAPAGREGTALGEDPLQVPGHPEAWGEERSGAEHEMPLRRRSLAIPIVLAAALVLPVGAAVGYLAFSGTLAGWLGVEGEAGAREHVEAAGESLEARVESAGVAGEGAREATGALADQPTAAPEKDPVAEASHERGPPGEEAAQDVTDIERVDTARAGDEHAEAERADAEGADSGEAERASADEESAERQSEASAAAPRRPPAASGDERTRQRPRDTAVARRPAAPGTQRPTEAKSGPGRVAARSPAASDDGGRTARGGAQDPARARIIASTAERHRRQGDHERALTLYQRAARVDPTEPTYQRQIGLAQLSLGREAQAIAPLRRYLQMAPNASDRPKIEQLIRQHGG